MTLKEKNTAHTMQKARNDMSREEAIKILNDYDINFERNTPEEVAEAHEMAIEALKPQPCNDCISRKAVLDGLASIAKAKAKSDSQKSLMGRVMFFTEHLPSVAPQPKEHTEERTEAHECDYINRKDIGLTNLEILMCNGDYKEALKMLLDKIEKAPSVTPQAKTGHWIGHREHCEKLGVIPSGLGVYEWCSNCDYGIDIRDWSRISHNYCPKCGIKMQEVKK